MAKHSLPILFFIILLNLTLGFIASRRTNLLVAQSLSRFSLIIAMLTAFFVGLVFGSEKAKELKPFLETWGIHTALLIGTISLLPHAFGSKSAAEPSCEIDSTVQ